MKSSRRAAAPLLPCVCHGPSILALRSPSINAHISDIIISGFATEAEDTMACLSAFPRHATLTSIWLSEVQDLEAFLRLCETSSPAKHCLKTVQALELEMSGGSLIRVI